MNGTLYRIINMKNGKSYVGKTYQIIYDRLYKHLSDAKCKRNTVISRALNKYGPEAFTLEILGEYSEGLLEEKEIEYIGIYNTYKDGYNSTLGGEGRLVIDISDSEVVEDFLDLKNLTEVALLYDISRPSVKRILERNGIEVDKDKKLACVKQRRGVYSPSLELSFSCAKECAEYLIINGITSNKDTIGVGRSISRVCNGNEGAKTYKGHTFIYTDKQKLNKRVYSPTLGMYFDTPKLCAQYLIDNNITAASLETAAGQVRGACNGATSTYKKHRFTYV